MIAINVLKNVEDDAISCGNYMTPHTDLLIDYATAEYQNTKAVSWALHWGFAYILSQLGDPHKLQINTGTYNAMQEHEQTAARDCKKRLQEIILATRREGFSLTAIAYAMTAPISQINTRMYREFLPAERAKREADELTELLFMALDKALSLPSGRA
jgi:hypothetical protein